MKIENVVLTETSELLSARLDCYYAGDGDGGGYGRFTWKRVDGEA